MNTRDKTLLTCAIALSGFGISIIGTSKAARQSPVTLLFTSVTLYLSEAVLFWCFFFGLWLLIKHMIEARNIDRPNLEIYPLPQVTNSTLRRFAFFQIAFVAVWSVCFKGVLYTTLNPAYSHHLMAKTQSLGIAIPAEIIILLLVLTALANWSITAWKTPRNQAS